MKALCVTLGVLAFLLLIVDLIDHQWWYAITAVFVMISMTINYRILKLSNHGRNQT